MITEKIREILDMHSKWMRGDSDGKRADLRGADLYGANLYGANLCGANLYGANLYGANLYGAKCKEELMAKFFPLCCPEAGAFIAWKKLREGRIAKLLIPEDALRSSAYGRKCRASKAVVVSIVDTNDNEVSEGYSKYDDGFRYVVGETVEVAHFDPDRWNECSTGIHFFITRQEAVDY